MCPLWWWPCATLIVNVFSKIYIYVHAKDFIYIWFFISGAQVQRRLGYCPQFDALLDQMTVEETLYMYGRLRGIKDGDIPGEVTQVISSLLLQDHTKKRCGELRYLIAYVIRWQSWISLIKDVTISLDTF